MADQKWHESNDPEVFAKGANRLAAKGALFWTCVIGGLVLLVAIAVVVIRFGFSDVGGQMEAQTEKNSAENRVAAQEGFVTRYNSVVAQDDNIQIAYDEKEADRDNQVKQINYSGLVRNCNASVADYNAWGQKFSNDEFRPDDLPPKLPDPNDPTNTDCKEDTK